MPENPVRMPPPVPPVLLAEEPEAEAGNLLTTLLKAPGRVARLIALEERGLFAVAVSFLGVAGICHALFGLALGLFAGWPVALMAAVKMPLVAISALLLCFPSLYVFSCVAGSPISLSQVAALGCSCLAMIGLLLVGLAPVAWLFAISTASLPFMVLLAFLIWLIALVFAARFVGKLGLHPLLRRQAGIRMWFWILILVTLQMTTCMRPMLGAPKAGWWTSEKKFFITHYQSIWEKPKR